MYALGWIEKTFLLVILLEIRYLEPLRLNPLAESTIGNSFIQVIEINRNSGIRKKDNQTNAISLCNDYDMVLPILDSTALFDFFCATLNDNNITDEIWVHATDIVNERDFIWDNGVDVSDDFFGGTAPRAQNRDCVKIHDNGTHCQLHDQRCDRNKGIICTMSLLLTPHRLHLQIGDLYITMNIAVLENIEFGKLGKNGLGYIGLSNSKVQADTKMATTGSKGDEGELLKGEFPPGFIWTSSSASYQIEGAWNADGKGESIWDRFSHTPGKVMNNDTGDIACDSYHKYEEDIKLLKNLGCSHYRFSVAWTRILSEGTKNVINPAGIAYYNKIIDGLLEAGIQPIVTLYHWDLPQVLQDQGGWANEQVVEWFRDYADVCYASFGDRVKIWVTLNEPGIFSWFGYGNGIFAPGINDPYHTFFKTVRHCIRAHTKAYRLYEGQYKKDQKGQVGISIEANGYFPLRKDNPADIEAVDIAYQVRLGMYVSPFYCDGDFPVEVLERAAEIGKVLNLSKPPLQHFSEEEKKENKGAIDFLGINNYTSYLVSLTPITDLRGQDLSLFKLFGIVNEVDPTWERAAPDWLYLVPSGLRKVLNWVKDEYENPAVIITENGTSDGPDSLIHDTHRSKFITSYLNEVLKASKLDGCRIRGYTVWSLTDNFEWSSGYSERFGLHAVDFQDPDRKRTPKDSVNLYKEIIKHNGFK